MRSLGLSLLLGLMPLNAATDNGYAIVVSASTSTDIGWKQVVAGLQARHPHAVVVTWKDSPLEAREPLTKLQPRFVAWVATPAEAGRNFVTHCHRIARQLDRDPWPDYRWGIITGRDAASAQRQLTGPTTVRPRVALSTTGIDLSHFERGLIFSDGSKGRWHEKRGQGDETGHATLPRPAAAMWADYFRTHRPDLLVSASHGFEHGFETPFGTGFLQVRDGTLVPLSKQDGPTVGDPLADDVAPKIFLPIGNCLVGHVDGPESMVCAMMGRLGVRQLIGYTVVTWFGRGGWDVLGTWQVQPGTYNLTDAFFINQARMEYDLLKLAPSAANFDLNLPNTGNPMPEPAFRRILKTPLATEALAGLEPNSKAAQERFRQLVGLLWDRETVAFYGDPAFDARLNPSSPTGWKLTAQEDHQGVTLTLTFSSDAEASKGAPDLAYFPTRRLNNPQLAAGPDSTLVADNLILLRQPRPSAGERDVRVRVTTQP